MVAETAARDIRGLFDGLLPAEVIDAYDRLLAQDGCAKEQADSLVGAELVDVLTHWGMAHVQPHTPADPAWLTCSWGRRIVASGAISVWP